MAKALDIQTKMRFLASCLSISYPQHGKNFTLHPAYSRVNSFCVGHKSLLQGQGFAVMKTKLESAPVKKKTSARVKSTEKDAASAETALLKKTKLPHVKKSSLEEISDPANSLLKPKRAKSAEPKTEVTAETRVRRTYTRRKKSEVPSILLEGDAPATPTASGPGEKYSLGATPPTQHFLAAESELPESYGTKKLFLTARDPHWLYAHWDLTREQQMKLNAQSSDGHLVLRIYAHKIEGHPAYEIHVHPESRHWFTHVERA
jgi:hypothetical protein